MGRVKLTKAHASLVVLLRAGFDARSIRRRDADRKGLLGHYDRCIKAGLLVPAGAETSAEADDWLSSSAGRAALKES